MTPRRTVDGRHLACALVAALVLLGALPFAAAHENQKVADGRSRILPGDAVEFTAPIHYHRLVGHVLSDGVAPLLIEVVGPRGTTAIVGPGTAPMRVNTLVACCDDATWTPHVVRVRNAGERAVDATIALSFLHDGFAVAAVDAETGAALSMLLFAGLPAAWGYRALRRHREITTPNVVASVAGLTALWALAGLIALPSMILYGGGPASGIVAAAAHLPWWGNAFVTTADLLTLLLLGLWITALVAWVGAARCAPRRRAVVVLAVVLAVGALASSAVWALEYRRWVVPLGAGALAASLPIVWLARRRADVGAGA